MINLENIKRPKYKRTISIISSVNQERFVSLSDIRAGSHS